MIKIVVDTNILVSTILSPQSSNRHLLQLCFEKRFLPVISTSLFLEYEDVLTRSHIVEKSPFSSQQRERLLNNFVHICQYTSIHYTWRPNLRDEGDNHVLELALAANCKYIVTYNIKDFLHSELKFPWINIVTPKHLLEQLSQ